MKKIIIITNKKKATGGANIAATRLATILKKNYKITILTIDKKSLIGKLKYNIARIIIKIFIGKTNFLNSLNIFTRINLKDIKTDLIHINWIGEETLSIKDIERFDKPIIWTFHDMWPATSTEHFLDNQQKTGYSKKDTHNNLIKKIIFDNKKKMFNKNINIITNNKWLEKFCRKSDLTKNSNIKTIYNPIETQNWFRENENYSKKKIKFKS